MNTVYKRHDIHASAWELLEPIGWEPRLYVSWWEAGQKITKSFTLNEVFSTRQEAGRAGLSFAQKWIDDGKPDRSSQTEPQKRQSETWTRWLSAADKR